MCNMVLNETHVELVFIISKNVQHSVSFNVCDLALCVALYIKMYQLLFLTDCIKWNQLQQIFKALFTLYLSLPSILIKSNLKEILPNTNSYIYMDPYHQFASKVGITCTRWIFSLNKVGLDVSSKVAFSTINANQFIIHSYFTPATTN